MGGASCTGFPFWAHPDVVVLANNFLRSVSNGYRKLMPRKMVPRLRWKPARKEKDTNAKRHQTPSCKFNMAAAMLV
ncbi:hypothetical protein ZHAS_00020624 [Anopheles sinensis]|uniref:Uncharacterized protein n=1 Tax=Anopheles sinensis TaxID=74873 RepID=A0A084WQ95_ANOSI|nr:hypothetical protein ZHAS_00020624 [Anopheles sinensis]